MEKINKEIVLLLINGSHSAFSKIYVKCHRQFFLLALRYLKSKEMAEDAVQYSFMRLWETRTQIDVEQGVEPYLYGILKNHLLNAYKFHQLTLEKKEEIILGMPLFEEETITQNLYRKQRDEAIRKALVLLPPQKRRICQMKIFEGLSNAEIARQLNITVNTVKVSYYKSILSLRESLNEKDFMCRYLVVDDIWMKKTLSAFAWCCSAPLFLDYTCPETFIKVKSQKSDNTFLRQDFTLYTTQE